MGTPQILILFFLSLSTVIGICLHGKPYDGDGKINGIIYFIRNAIIAWILYSGGFWSQ